MRIKKKLQLAWWIFVRWYAGFLESFYGNLVDEYNQIFAKQWTNAVDLLLRAVEEISSLEKYPGNENPLVVALGIVVTSKIYRWNKDNWIFLHPPYHKEIRNNYPEKMWAALLFHEDQFAAGIRAKSSIIVISSDHERPVRQMLKAFPASISYTVRVN